MNWLFWPVSGDTLLDLSFISREIFICGFLYGLAQDTVPRKQSRNHGQQACDGMELDRENGEVRSFKKMDHAFSDER